MNNDYLIPANSKKSMLILGLFTKLDLIIFGIGLGITMILLIALPVEHLTWALIAIAPGLIAGFLVLPVPSYHNMRVLLSSAFTFFTTRQRFIWKGWCVLDGSEQETGKK
ncbi:MAG: hypothetical protein PHD10_00745 [Bacilli bacterium]|nr:hypothetical protein [Bacilli bacterium]MDD4607649.1 hypothetical protein [Bacilli bacterium]